MNLKQYHYHMIWWGLCVLVFIAIVLVSVLVVVKEDDTDTRQMFFHSKLHTTQNVHKDMNVSSVDVTGILPRRAVEQKGGDFLKSMIHEIVYINLDKCPKRNQNFQKEMKNIFDLSDDIPIRRFPGILKSYNGALGCLMSHVSILKQALQRSEENNILVCEDDLMFVVGRDELVRKLKMVQTQVGDNWDVIIFGQYCLGWSRVKSQSGEVVVDKEYDDYLMKMLHATTTSGYLVNKRYIPVLYDYWYKHLENTYHKKKFQDHEHLDQVQIELQKKGMWFGFSKPIGVQREGYSIIGDTQSNNFWKTNDSLTEFYGAEGRWEPLDLQPDFQL